MSLTKGHALTYFVVAFCLVIDGILFFGHGLDREYAVNSAYLEFIRDFPESVSHTRVEPVFVILSSALSWLISSPIWSIVLLKILIVGLVLLTFARLTWHLTRSHLFALASILFLNFSFAFFSLSDNLLRNQLANLSLLLAFLPLVRLLHHGTLPKKDWWLVIGAGGLLLYTHILPTLIFDSTLLLLGIVSGVRLALGWWQKRTAPSNQSDSDFKQRQRIFFTLIALGTMILIIQLPSLLRLIHAQANVGDYKIVQSSELPTQTGPHEPLLPNTPPRDFLAIGSLWLRILFEFRLPGFSLFFIGLTGLAVIIPFLRRPSLAQPTLLIVLWWATTYAGSKIDLLFGIGTLPYRFSLMLIFPSLLLILVLLNRLTRLVAEKRLQYSLILVLLTCFFGNNIVSISEVTLLRSYEREGPKTTYLHDIYNKLFGDQTQLNLLVNGESFEGISAVPVFLRNDHIFSTTNDTLLKDFMTEYKVAAVVFDHHRIKSKGNDIGTVTNTNLTTFEQSPFFISQGEFIGQGTHLSIFSFSPTPQTPREPSKIVLTCNTEVVCQQTLDSLLTTQPAKINRWTTEINHTDILAITEFISLTNGRLIEIHYTKPTLYNDWFIQRASVELYHFSERPATNEVLVTISKAVMLLHHEEWHLLQANLEEFTTDCLTLFGTLSGETLHYTTLTRNGYRATLQALLLMWLILGIWCIWRRYQPLAVTHTTHQVFVGAIAFLAILDMLVVHPFFSSWYKHLLGV